MAFGGPKTDSCIVGDWKGKHLGLFASSAGVYGDSDYFNVKLCRGRNMEDRLKFYLAPMEGITGYIFRNAWEEFFGGMDKYVTPFISPNTKKCFTTKEKRDILPENNQGKMVVPQILTAHPEYFIDTAKRLHAYGYQEINFNLGCPSGTVITKKKGAGFLAYPGELDQFLEVVFEEIYQKQKMKISIKTRLGIDREEEFYAILAIYNKYPLEELIVHPRVQKDFYKEPVHLDFLEKVLEKSRIPVCYNGDIFTPGLYGSFTERFPAIDRIMLGRGILVNPGLLEQIKTGKHTEKDNLYSFLNRLCKDYEKELSGEKPVLYKMKELWFYLAHSFTNYEPYAKNIKKAGRLLEYQNVVEWLFAEQELKLL